MPNIVKMYVADCTIITMGGAALKTLAKPTSTHRKHPASHSFFHLRFIKTFEPSYWGRPLALTGCFAFRRINILRGATENISCSQLTKTLRHTHFLSAH